MAENLTTNYLINFIAQTQGIENARKAIAKLENELKKVYGSEVKITAVKGLQRDAEGTTKAILNLHNAIKGIGGKTGATITTTPVGGNFVIPKVGGQELKWNPKAQRWVGGGGKFTSLPPDIASTFKRGPIEAFSMEHAANLEKTTIATEKHSKSVGHLAIKYGELAIRAVSVIPIWMVLREGYTQLIAVFTEGAKHIVEFDKALTRAKVVTKGTDNLPAFMGKLREEIQKLAIETGKSTTEIAEAYYRFGTSGLNATEAQAGMQSALKTSIGVMGDLTDVARIMADVYNLMGDRIEGASTIQDKFNVIGSTMAVLWRQNTFEIGEFTEGMRNFAATGSNVNLTFDQMSTLLAVSHTLMQRNATAGTQLSRMFIMMLENQKALQDVLGRGIDFSKENLFTLLLETLKTIDIKFGDTAQKAKAITDIFGMRGGLVAQSFAKNLGLVVSELERIQSMPIEDRLKEWNYLFNEQIDTFDTQIKILGELKKVFGETFIRAITGGKDLLQVLRDISKIMEEVLIPAATSMGNTLQIAWKTMTFPFTVAEKISGAIGNWAGTPRGELPKYVKKQIEGFDRMKYGYYSTPEPDNKKSTSPVITRLTTKEFERQLVVVERLKALGYSSLQIEQMKLTLIKKYYANSLEYTEKVEEQQKRIVQVFNDEIIKLSETLQKSISSSLSDFLKGESTASSTITKIGDTIRDSIFNSISEGITSKLFKTTGMGESFAALNMGVKNFFSGDNSVVGGIKGAFDYGANLTYDSLVRGFRDGNTAFNMASTAGWTGSIAGGQGGTFGNYQGGGVWSPPMSAWNSGGFATGRTMTYGGKRYPVTTNKSSGGASQGFGIGIQGALTGYSAYQSARAGGVSTGQSVGSGVLSAGGGMALMGAIANWGATGALLGMGPVGWAILGGVALIGGLMMGSMGKKSRQTSVEVKTTENRIASKIDVTNKNLEIINRNLIALKGSIETYILPSTAYFSTKRNIEDQWSLMSRMGFNG